MTVRKNKSKSRTLIQRHQAAPRREEARKSVQDALAKAKGFLPTDDDDSGAFMAELDGDADGSGGLPSYKMIMSEDPTTRAPRSRVAR